MYMLNMMRITPYAYTCTVHSYVLVHLRTYVSIDYFRFKYCTFIFLRANTEYTKV